MSDSHLIELRKRLENSHWVLVSELSGNDYDISARWLISRPDGSHQMHLEFEGLDDMNTLPLEQSYGCRVMEAPTIKLYFSRLGRAWKNDLSKFMKQLNDIAR